MPQGGRAIPIGPCPHCNAPHLYTIEHNDGHGMATVLETHCNQCGYCVDGEGNIRGMPRLELVNLQHGGSKERG